MNLYSANGIALANAGTMHPAGDPSAKGAENPLLNSPTVKYERRIKWLSRMMAGLLVGLVLSICGNVFGSLRIVKYPVIIERTASGEMVPISIEPHKPVDVRPQDMQMATVTLVKQVRRAGYDEKMYGDQWAEAKTFLTKKTIAMMVPLINERLAWIRKGGTVDVQITSYLPIAGQDGKVVQVEWTETHVEKNGILKQPGGIQHWKATFKIYVVAADPTTKTDPKDLKNPLGIFIQDYTWEEKDKEKKR
jgi:type IV secretory pathway TrbF-like protein